MDASNSDDYAQEDTRMALIEARKVGVHPFASPWTRMGGATYSECTVMVGTQLSIGRSAAVAITAIYRRLTR